MKDCSYPKECLRTTFRLLPLLSALHFRPMVRLSRGPLALFLLLLLMASSPCQGTRNVQVFDSRQAKPPRNPRFFFGFLPKAMPIPPSGPSKQHNSVGLQSNTRG